VQHFIRLSDMNVIVVINISNNYNNIILFLLLLSVVNQINNCYAVIFFLSVLIKTLDFG